MKPHRTDGLSLSFGLIFLLIALWWVARQVWSVHLPAPGWLVAGALIFFGAAGLMGAIRSGRRGVQPAPVPATVGAPADASAATSAETPDETPGDLPPQMHADIVRELLEDPSDRVDLKPPAERGERTDRGE